MSGLERNDIHVKLNRLKEYLRELKRVAVAFSGGVDSVFLLYVARDTLGDDVLAVTASAEWFPAWERNEAKEFCAQNGIRQIICKVNASDISGFSDNPPNRCYLCKKVIFSRVRQVALENDIYEVVDGSNVDDDGDYRPGMQAIKELGVKSPLKVAGLTKSEIRELSRELGLSTFSKPSFACLASRFEYGDTIDSRKLSMVERAEKLLMDMGLKQVRVRIHGTIARIEVLPEDFGMLIEESRRLQVYERFKEYGFSYVTMDLMGYRMGSMNEQLGKKENR